MGATRSDRMTGAAWGDAARSPAAGGAVAGVAGALLALAAARHGVPGRIAELVGPPPLPSLLAAVSLAVAPIAGALVARPAARVRGPPTRRIWRLLVRTFVGYLATVSAAATATALVRSGLLPLLVPFGLLGYGLMLALLLLPWCALPILGTALVVEGWTRPEARGRRPWSFPLTVMLAAAAALLAT